MSDQTGFDQPTSGGSNFQVLLTTAQAASLLHIKATTLRKWRVRGVGPAWVKLGGAVRYLITDLDTYVDQAKIKPLNQEP